MPPVSDFNLNHAYDRDKDLFFDPDTHVYTLANNDRPLTSVTAFISSFFEVYDPYFWLHQDNNLSPQELLLKKSEQDHKGFVARNLGTFMHTQIENFFLGKEVTNEMKLEDEHGVKHSYSIRQELNYFQDFVQEYMPSPYRTEWMIYDEDLWLAGTLDMLVEEPDGTFTIYDWKRSRRMGREFGSAFYPNDRNFRQSGQGILSHLADTPFVHASLQQNLYKHILKNKYGIEVKKMYLVILSPTFSRFHKIAVPEMSEEIRLMLE